MTGLCQLCRGLPAKDARAAIQAHNLACATTGERSYPTPKPRAPAQPEPTVQED